MTTNLSPKEWETLSAYLDEQLSSQERKRLEIRLQNTPGLRAALEELRRTRVVLRSQPKVRAPRNFTLTPQMVGMRAAQRQATRAYSALGWVSALASLLLIIVLGREFLLGSQLAFPAQEMRSKVSERSVSAPLEQEQPLPTSVEVTVLVEVGAVAPQPTATEVPPSIMSEAFPSPTEALSMTAKVLPELPGEGATVTITVQVEALGVTLTQTVVAEGMSTPAAKIAPEGATTTPMPETTPIPTAEALLPTSEATATSQTPSQVMAPYPSPDQSAAQNQVLESEKSSTNQVLERQIQTFKRYTFRILEAALALLALGAGLAAYFLRRAGNG